MSSNSKTVRAYRHFTEERQDTFLDNLATTGNLEASAAAVGINPRTAYAWMQKSDEFREQVNQARAQAMTQIEREIARRGINGVQQPVYYQGEVVGQVTQYSDRLLLALARANDPNRWSEKQHVVTENHTVDGPESAKNKLLKLLDAEAIEGTYTDNSCNGGKNS